MIPDEQPQAASQTTESSPVKGRRRSRRGGRRHPKRRAPGSADSDATPRHAAEAEPSAAEADAPTARILRSEEAAEEAPAVSPARERAVQPHATAAKHPGVSQAIEQVTRVIEELKVVVDEMEEVLETLELAERQKIDDEREIESLQRALRHLHRPSHSSGAGIRQ